MGSQSLAFLGGIILVGFLYFIYTKIMAEKNKSRGGTGSSGGASGGLKRK